MPDTYGQVSGPVSNFYSNRTRTANGILSDAAREGFSVDAILEIQGHIPVKNRGKWDKDIRW